MPDHPAAARGRAARSTSPARSPVTGAMLLLVYTVVEAPDVGWGSARTIGSLIGVAALLAAFVAVERRTRPPLVRLGILRSARCVRANLGAMTLFGGLGRLPVRRHAVPAAAARLVGARDRRWRSSRPASSWRSWRRAWRPRARYGTTRLIAAG